MKNFQTILFLSILVILIPMYVYGVNIEFNIYADSQKYNVDEKDYIIVKIQLGDFINISDNVPLGYTAIIEYDKSIFESVSITGKNEWNAVFNERTNMIEGDTAKASANTEIAELRFEINQENAKQNENTIIKVKEILITDGNAEIKTERQIEIELTQNTGEQLSQDIQKIKNYSIITGKNLIDTTTSSAQERQLPNAGIEDIIKTIRSRNHNNRYISIY